MDLIFVWYIVMPAPNPRSLGSYWFRNLIETRGLPQAANSIYVLERQDVAHSAWRCVFWVQPVFMRRPRGVVHLVMATGNSVAAPRDSDTLNRKG